jgi:hypothetical protein
MRTVYIVGAGCTCNYRPTNRLKLGSPLDKDFFDICNTIFLAKRDISAAFADLTEHLASLFGLELGTEKGFKAFSLETVTTILDLESREKGRRYIDSLINLICIVFDIVLEGPTSPIHNELVKRLKPSDVIISYNYDLVIDNSLMECQSVEESVYGLNFDRKYDADWKPCEDEASGIRLLKLHGSMNWLKCNRCGALLFYRGRKAVAELAYQLMDLRQSARHLTCPICQSRELRTLLIPPLLEKELYSEESRYSWFLAERSIASADRIVVIGYSLPPTDFYSEFLLRKATSGRFRSLSALRVVDKETKVIPKRFEKILHMKNSEVFCDLREYLDKTGD